MRKVSGFVVTDVDRDCICADIYQGEHKYSIEFYRTGMLGLKVENKKPLQGEAAHNVLDKNVKGYKKVLKACLGVLGDHLKDVLAQDLKHLRDLKKSLT
jgi:hypothetical protein